MVKNIMLAGVLTALSFALPVYGATDIQLANGTVASGASEAFSASQAITAGPSYVVQPGAALSLYAGESIVLLPGFHAQAGSAVLMRVTGPDTDPPAVHITYPGDGDLIASQGGPVSLLAAFSDSRSGIDTVTLRDSSGTDITAQAIIDAGTLEYVIHATADADYSFTLIVEDMLGNTTTKVVSFRIDATIPESAANTAGGHFAAPVQLAFTCSEDATLYYSTDGYPPFIGAANTVAVPAAEAALTIDGTTRLTYFSVDAAGNIETAKSVVYYFDDVPPTVTDLDAVYDDAGNHIALAWSTPSVPVAAYRVYRAVSLHDLHILEDSRVSGYRPPERL